MEIDETIEFIEEQINEFEKNVYQFESIIRPRYEKDKEILKDMREQHLKLQAIKEKEGRGETVAPQDIREAIPAQFRRG